MLEMAPRLDDPDGFYSALVSAHDGLTAEQSAALNARLIFILSNQIGDTEVLKQAIAAAAE